MPARNPVRFPHDAAGVLPEGNVAGGKFSACQVAALRKEIVKSELDYFQTAEIINSFVTAGGYAISHEMAWQIAVRLERMNEGVESLHRQLEASALAM